jgi:hypothetical protein
MPKIFPRGSFMAKSESGKKVEIFVSQEMTGVPDLSGKGEMGDLVLKTKDGKDVNRIEKGSYEIVGVPAIAVTSSDPNAP